MAEDTLYVGSVKVERLQALIADCHRAAEKSRPEEQPYFVLLEWLPDQIIIPAQRRNLLLFDYYDTLLQNDIALANYSSGRFFYQAAEVRWLKSGNQLQIAYSGQVDMSVATSYDLHEVASWKQSNSYSTKQRPYYLFGTHLRDVDRSVDDRRASEFAEVRIPRVLRYPVKADVDRRYAAVTVHEYLDEQTGQVAHYRFTGVNAKKAEGGSK